MIIFLTKKKEVFLNRKKQKIKKKTENKIDLVNINISKIIVVKKMNRSKSNFQMKIALTLKKREEKKNN